MQVLTTSSLQNHNNLDFILYKYCDILYGRLQTYALFPGILKQLQFVVTNLLSIAFLGEVHCPVGEKFQ